MHCTGYGVCAVYNSNVALRRVPLAEETCLPALRARRLQSHILPSVRANYLTQLRSREDGRRSGGRLKRDGCEPS